MCGVIDVRINIHFCKRLYGQEGDELGDEQVDNENATEQRHCADERE